MEINIEQLGIEAGVEIKGVRTKGEDIFFLDLSPEDETLVRNALKTHVPVWPKQPSNQDIMDKLLEIQNA